MNASYLINQINFPIRYYLGTPERHPGQQHLYRVSSSPPKTSEALSSPQCLTCTKQHLENAFTTTATPPKLATAWDDDWESEPTLPPPPTSAPKKKRKKG